MYNWIKQGSVYTNPYSGLISKNIPNISNDTLDKYASIRYENKRKLTQLPSENKVIKTINIHPVGRMCYGSCEYCYNLYYPYTSFSDGYLTAERFSNFLAEIEPKLNDPVLLKFTGGSCFLYDDLYKLFNVAKKYMPKLHLRFHADLMYPEEIYQNVLKTFEKLSIDDDVESVKMYVTVDYGSDTRYAKNIHLTSDDIRARALDIINRFGDIDKFQIEIKINLNIKTDIDTMCRGIDTIINKPCWIVYNPVRHKEFSPTVQQLSDCISKIDSNYESHVVYWREKIIMNDYTKKGIAHNNENSLTTIFKTVNEDTIVYSPYYFDCPGYTVATGISPTKYLPCFIGYLEEDTVSNSLSLNPNNKICNDFLNITEECSKCEYLGICMRCMLRRKLLPCSIVPSLKFWEKHIWESKINQNDYWLDENLNKLRW